jgi:hypothetical protein
MFHEVLQPERPFQATECGSTAGQYLIVSARNRRQLVLAHLGTPGIGAEKNMGIVRFGSGTSFW